MKTTRVAALLWTVLVLVACGSEDDQAVCDEAFDKWCACPQVSCDGHPESCPGPDKEWAECILDAADPCTAACM